MGTPEMRVLWGPRRLLRTTERNSPLKANAVPCTLTPTLLRLSPKFCMSSQTYSALESKVSREVTGIGKEELQMSRNLYPCHF